MVVVCPVYYRRAAVVVPRGTCRYISAVILRGLSGALLGVVDRVWLDAVPPVELNEGGAMQGELMPLVPLMDTVTVEGRVALVVDASAAMGGTMCRGR